MVIKEQRKISTKRGEYIEKVEEEGILDIYVKLCKKLNIPPVLGIMNFIFLLLLLFSVLFVYSKSDLISYLTFLSILVCWVCVNLYLYKLEKQKSL